MGWLLRLVTGGPLVVGGPRQLYFILNQRGGALASESDGGPGWLRYASDRTFRRGREGGGVRRGAVDSTLRVVRCDEVRVRRTRQTLVVDVPRAYHCLLDQRPVAPQLVARYPAVRIGRRRPRDLRRPSSGDVYGRGAQVRGRGFVRPGLGGRALRAACRRARTHRELIQYVRPQIGDDVQVIKA